MIFRRTAQAIRKQDWFTVIIEFILIVVGVLVALQVDEWQRDAEERTLEEGYLVRLKEDFTSSLSALNQLSGFHAFQIDGLKKVADALEHCALVETERDRFAQALFHMGKVNEPPFNKRTINELEAAGGFRLIKSPEIKSYINEAIAEANQTIQVHRSLLDRVTPAVNRAYRTIRFSFPDGSSQQAGWQHLSMDFEANCGNQAFINDLYYVRMNIFNIERFFTNRARIYREAIKTIDTELAGRFGRSTNADPAA